MCVEEDELKEDELLALILTVSALTLATEYYIKGLGVLIVLAVSLYLIYKRN